MSKKPLQFTSIVYTLMLLRSRAHLKYAVPRAWHVAIFNTKAIHIATIRIIIIIAINSIFMIAIKTVRIAAMQLTCHSQIYLELCNWIEVVSTSGIIICILVIQRKKSIRIFCPLAFCSVCCWFVTLTFRNVDLYLIEFFIHSTTLSLKRSQSNSSFIFRRTMTFLPRCLRTVWIWKRNESERWKWNGRFYQNAIWGT